MPELFYGRLLPEDRKRSLYALKPFRLIETGIFDRWKVKKLAPRSRKTDLALLWWFRSSPHTGIAWHDSRGNEQLVILPGLLPQEVMLPLVREVFPEALPSAITFRVFNERKPYLYD